VEVLRNLAVVAVAVAALASCSGEEEANHADHAASTTGASSTSSIESGTGSRSPSALPQPATSAKDLFAVIDAAVANETSVRQELGNLNPPPPVVLEQEYGDDRDHPALTVDIGHGTDPLQIYRVDGLIYAEGQDPKPTSEIDPDDTALIAVMVRSDVRQDFQRMARLADDFSYVGEEDILGVTTRHYRVTLALTPGANPASLPSQVKGPKPADLWIATSGLPVRVEVKYSEPLNGVPGTGVGRTDYAGWSEPLRLDPTNLDWE
jgi:hypothetical protein